MVVDLTERETESGTFELKGGGAVHVRLLSEKDVEEIIRATRSNTAEYPLLKDPLTGKEAYQRFEVTRFDADLFDEMNFERSITGWENIYDRTGKLIPVTTENKVLLMTRVPEFREAVEKGLLALRKAASEKKDAEAKNELPT